MSGGSFNYLCHAFDLDDLIERRGSLEAMASELAGLGYAQDAARETEELLVMLRQWEVRATVRVERLREVWKAVEWWRSCDYSEDRVHEALSDYRGDNARNQANQMEQPMTGPCPRPECGGTTHTDGWGNPTRCPRACSHTLNGLAHDAHNGCPGWMPEDGTRPEAPPAATPLEEAQAAIESLRYQIRRAREALGTDEAPQPEQDQVRRERDELRALLYEILGHFVHKGHPGEPCLQTGWISVRTVQRWRDALNKRETQ
ncbi:hypothetical protein [Streptomyces flaveolus]|uniref:hypothetical protein n=1 Tax=Streptomyces flaveolus TaxID=67297 RepID=UPI0033F7C87E